MKKNWTMRVGALMLALTLITSCFVGGTFAKYVTDGEGKNSARVAEFGVHVEAEGNGFSKTYAKHEDTEFALTVEAEEEVVAPGTSGTLAGFTMTGAPEVAVRVTTAATKVDFGDNWVDANGDYYCPIEITVGTTTLKGLDYETIEEFEAAIVAAIAEFSAEYAANTDLSTITDDVPVIGWEWKFDVNDDAKDTNLGDQAADGAAATIAIDTTVTVTQID